MQILRYVLLSSIKCAKFDDMIYVYNILIKLRFSFSNKIVRIEGKFFILKSALKIVFIRKCDVKITTEYVRSTASYVLDSS